MSVSVRQTLRIFEMLAHRPEGLRLTDLAAGTASSRASILRLVRLLREEGYVDQDPTSERWRATLRLAALGMRQLDGIGAGSWGYERILKLARETNELVPLAVAAGDRMLWVAQAQGSRSVLTVVPEIGSEVVLHASAVGKAYLSTLANDEVLRILDLHGMDSRTPATINDPDTLLADLEGVRRSGYAMVVEELEAGVNAIAAPIRPARDPEAPAVGGLSIAGPSARLDPKRLRDFVPLLLDAVNDLAAEWPAYRAISLFPVDEESGRRGWRAGPIDDESGPGLGANA